MDANTPDSQVTGTAANRSRRRQSGLLLLAAALLLAVFQYVTNDGSVSWLLVVLILVLAAYALWLSTPRFGSTRFEVAIARDVATTTIPAAFCVGLLVSLLVDR